MRPLVVAVGLAVAFTVAARVVDMVTNDALSRLRGAASEALRRHRFQRRRDLVLHGRLERWLVRYYAGSPWSDGLATFQSGKRIRELAVYAPPHWLVAGRVPIDLAEFDPVVPTGNVLEALDDVPKPRAVRRRERLADMGIWNGPALLVGELPQAYDSQLSARSVGYFERAERIIQLEEESLRSARLAIWPARHRRRRLNGARAIPSGVGGTVVLVIDHPDGEPEVMLHRRASTVATNPGMWCTTPTFVMEDPQAVGGSVSKRSVIAWNVLRETLEEAYGAKVERPTGQWHSDWFLDQGRGRDLAKRLDSEKLHLTHLGWFVDLVNGLLDVMVLVQVQGTPADLAAIKVESRASATEMASGEAIVWEPLFGEKLTRRCLEPSFHAGCALAIRMARDVLAPPGASQVTPETGRPG